MIIAIFIIIAVIIIYQWSSTPAHIDYGITFSQKYAEEELGLDWQKTYLAILDDLGVDHIRLSAYWDLVESQPDEYDFSDLDWQINEATKRNVKITLALGRRLPRWPECHAPSWLTNLGANAITAKQLALVENIIQRYQNNLAIVAWQVENEPFLDTFGKCPPLNRELLDQEISLVKQLDPSRPIIITDSGELSTWLPAAKTEADVLGSTLYRVVHNKYIGYWHWPLPATYYRGKMALVKILTGKKVILSELQAESWHATEKNLSQMTLAEHNKSLSVKQLAQNIAFAQKAGFDEIYLWGAEWWYFMKEKQNYPGYWEEAKKLWENGN